MTEKSDGKRDARQRAGRKVHVEDDAPHDEVDDTTRLTSREDREAQEEAFGRMLSDQIAEQDGQPLVDWDAMPPVHEWDEFTTVIYRDGTSLPPDPRLTAFLRGDTMTESPDEKRATPESIGELLDVPGEVPDDGQERNWDGQTRREFLEMLQEAHDNGSVQMDHDRWYGIEDATGEVGAEEVARLRAEMQTYLKDAWAELDAEQS